MTNKERPTKYSAPNTPIPTASTSISANPTPPSGSPYRSFSIASFIHGNTTRHEGQNDAVQRVNSGFLLEADSNSSVENSSELRTLGSKKSTRRPRSQVICTKGMHFHQYLRVIDPIFRNAGR